MSAHTFRDLSESYANNSALVEAEQDRIESELKCLMVSGMNSPGNAKPVPYAVYKANGSGSVHTQPFAAALADMLDYDDVLSELWAVLAGSQCPQVAALKLTIATKLALERSPDLVLLGELK